MPFSGVRRAQQEIRSEDYMIKARRGALLLLLAVIFFWPGPPGPARAGDDWQPIAPEDLALKDNPASPGAPAMILYRESFINGKTSAINEYYRVKIFTEKGKTRGDVEIPFTEGQSAVKDLRARTIRPNGTVVNFDGKTFDKLVVKISGLKVHAKTFSLPDVQPGCIIEYKYRLQLDPNYFYDTQWLVQDDDLFTRRAVFSIVPPQASGYGLFSRAVSLPRGTHPETQKDGTYRMEVKNIAALQAEEYMPPEDEVRGRIDFFYRKQGPETPEEFWKRTGKGWDDAFERFINKKGPVQQAVAQTVGAGDTPEMKLQKLYERARQVRDPYLNTEKTAQEEKRESLKDNNNVDDVLKHNYGNGRDINYLFVALARAAGFEADDVLVAARSRHFFHPDLQDTQQLNADVVYVRLGTQDLYLDPACGFCPYGLLPWYETGVSGLRLSKDGGTFVNTNVLSSSNAITERSADLTLSADGSLEGKLQVDFKGEDALGQREDARTEDDAGRRKQITDEIQGQLPPGTHFQLTAVKNWEGSAEPLHAEGTLSIPGVGVPAGHRLLFPVAVLRVGKKAPFRHEERTFPVYFRYPSERVDDVILHLPPGYRVETLPAVKPTTAGLVTYQLTANQDGDTVHIVRHEAVNAILFPIDQYPAIRTIFGSMQAGDEQQAILQSTETAQK
jgi:Domain of Unknown Function with PDB structure (DUF3857)/Transglutaminase-like superfamily